MAMDMEERINSISRKWKYIEKSLSESERERDNTRDRSELIIIQIDEAKGMVRLVRDIERKARCKAIGGII